MTTKSEETGMKARIWWGFAALVLAPVARAADGDAARAVSFELGPKERQVLVNFWGKGVVGDPVPGVTIQDGSAWFGLAKKKETWRMSFGPQKGKEIEITLAPKEGDEKGKSWRKTVGKDLSVFLDKTALGGIRVTSKLNSERGTITKFTPGLPQVLSGLKPGQTDSSKFKVGVFDFSHPDHLKHEGTLELEFSHLGNYEVVVPAGRFEAALLKWNLSGRVGPAKIVDLQYKLLVKGRGVVAAIDRNDLTAGVFHKEHKKSARVLLKSE
jgi:hypothetical protein